jgi:hypothetical protein
LDDQKLKKKIQLKIKFVFIWSKIVIYLSLGLHKMSKLQEKASAFKIEHPALQNRIY